MKIAVTGGSGFIGQRLVNRLLSQGHTVNQLSRRDHYSHSSNLHYFKGDLYDRSSLESFLAGAEILFHCAGEVKDLRLMENTHVQGTQNLIDAASGKIKRWIQLSSIGVYGQNAATLIDETSASNPYGTYEITKAQADAFVLGASSSAKINPVILRPSNVFGRQMSNQYLYQLISLVDKQLFFFIGNKGAIMNNIHVENVIDALLLCATHPEAPGKIFNLSDQLPIEKYIAIIATALQRPLPKLRLPKLPLKLIVQSLGKFVKLPLNHSRIEALSRRSSYSCEKIKQVLGYEHRISLEEGLIEMIADYQGRKNSIHE